MSWISTPDPSVTEHLKLYAKQTPLWPALKPRAFQAFCIGAPKTGTHSVAGLFAKQYRTKHEPAYDWMAHALGARRNGALSTDELADLLRQRDREFWLSMESSHATAWFADLLVDIFPDSKFILTVREPVSWFQSIANQHYQVHIPPENGGAKLRDLYHDRGHDHAAEAQILDTHGLYPLDGYLAYWRDHNEFVLDAVPDDRLLVLKTQDLSGAADRIASFLQVPPHMLNHRKKHRYKASKKKDFVGAIDPDFLSSKVETYCSATADRLAPYIGDLV